MKLKAACATALAMLVTPAFALECIGCKRHDMATEIIIFLAFLAGPLLLIWFLQKRKKHIEARRKSRYK